ncbi:ATP-binding cassette domain-containing protein [Staphylococcus casei]|uniref:ATP-binding cassette domain-containing protein n=1 Tax=Staphylococcus casei TaxID=201828 RepID=A0ABZ2WBI3_9STAP
MNVAVEAENISKSLDTNLIINKLSFNIPEHSITLIKGKNGVGKSLTLKMIANLMTPNNGKISVYHSLSYAPDVFPKNIKLTVQAFLSYMNKLNANNNSDKMNFYLDLLNLAHFQNKPLHQLSKGSLQKVNIIQCLLTDAQIIILDEPFSGLDYDSEKRLIAHLKVLSKTKTIILTAHNHHIENSIVTHTLNLDDYSFNKITTTESLKLITIPDHKPLHPDIQNLIQSANSDENNRLMIKVYQSQSNSVIQKLINDNFDIIEVKDI